MSEGKFQVRDIKGLTPSLDPTQSQELFALSGRNYVFDSLGVKSPFGNRFLSPIPLGQPRHVQGVRLRLRGGDRCFTITAYGIWEWDEAKGGWKVIYDTPDTTVSPYRWTYEYLNGYMYFAHPRVGLLVLNMDTGRCDPHDAVGRGTPDQIISVSQNNGRLVLMTPILFAWSAPSNGLDFTPTFGGAGFQVISERVPGDPIMAQAYARGVLTWTTGGVMRSEFTGDTAVYRHRTFNTEFRPINSFCLARLDEDTVVFLDERGLFQSRGEAITPYAPLFNEFLINFLQDNDYRNGYNVRLEWDDLQRRMYLSYSDSYSNPLYEKCFVYYPPLDKWGEFNESHYGIIPLLIGSSERADDYYGFVDSEGSVRYWLGTGSREKAFVDSDYDAANLYRPVIGRPSQYADDEDALVLSTTARLTTIPTAGYTKVEGFYASGINTPMLPQVTGLNALIRFGLIRLTGPNNADEMSEITSAIVRSAKSGESDVLTEDFNVVPDGTSDEDYQVEVGAGVDLGLSPLNYINHSFELVGTLDGDSEFHRVAPEMVEFKRAARFYACSVVGIWHYAEIGAIALGEAFHVKTFELNGTSAGRYL